MKAISVFVADQYVMVRQGLVALLDQASDFTVAGDTGDAGDAVAQVKKLQPDVILLDSMLAKEGDSGLIGRIQAAASGAKVLILAASLRQYEVRQALQDGAAGYILKTAPFSELSAAIENAAAGQYYLSSEIKSDIIDNFLKQSDETAVQDRYNLLTRREKEVFRIIVSGHTINEVAEALNISPKTVAKHRASLMEKLEIYNVASLVRYAIKIGVLAG